MPEPVDAPRHLEVRSLDDPDAAIPQIRRDRDACPAVAALVKQHLAFTAQLGYPGSYQPEAFRTRVISDIRSQRREARHLAACRIEHHGLPVVEGASESAPKIARLGIDRQSTRIDLVNLPNLSASKVERGHAIRDQLAEIDPSTCRVGRKTVIRPDHLARVEFLKKGRAKPTIGLE